MTVANSVRAFIPALKSSDFSELSVSFFVRKKEQWKSFIYNITRTIRHLEIDIIQTGYTDIDLNILTGVPLPCIRIKVRIA